MAVLESCALAFLNSFSAWFFRSNVSHSAVNNVTSCCSRTNADATESHNSRPAFFKYRGGFNAGLVDFVGGFNALIVMGLSI